MATDSADNSVSKPRSSFSLRDLATIEGLFLPLAERFVRRDSSIVDGLQSNLTQARIPTPVESYLARLIGWSIVVGAALWAGGSGLGVILYTNGIIANEPLLNLQIPNETVLQLVNTLRIPALILVMGLISGGIAAVGVGFIAYFIPASRASSREREIEALLPDAVSFMYALSVGGMNQLDIFRTVADAEDTYGEVSREFQSVVQSIEYGGEDYRSALRKAAIQTPSTELDQFITDMLSIISSGGDIESFLEQEKDKFISQAKKEEESRIEMIELSGEIFITLSVAPVMLLIVFLVMDLLGSNSQFIMTLAVYVITPMLSVAYLVLVSTIQPDELGAGQLKYNDVKIAPTEKRYNLSRGQITNYEHDDPLFSSLNRRAVKDVITDLLFHPHLFFRDNPLYTLLLTVPLSLAGVGSAIAVGTAPTSWGALTEAPIAGTVIYVYFPLYVVGVPLAVANTWNNRYYRGVTNNLSDHLRKISSANDTGQTLLESFETVAANDDDKLTRELEQIVYKVRYGTSLKRSLIEFNNKYRIPSLARIIRLITEAHETSGEISDVLTTAAQVTENQGEIERKRKTATNAQVFIIVIAFTIMVGIMGAIQFQMVDLIRDLLSSMESASSGAAGGGGSGGGSGLSFQSVTKPPILTTLFFHVLVIQGLFAGIAAGYMRSGTLLAGIKFSIPMTTLPLIVWIVIVNIL